MLHSDGESLHIDWEDLRYFAAFVEARSLSAAAARLSVDHATVGRRIAALEATLGVKLVDRRARIPVLTAAGTRIAGRVERVEDAVFGVARAVRGLAPALGGEVSISAPPTLAHAVIAPQLAVLRARHPAIRVRLVGEKRIASLARREADVSLRLLRPTEAGVVGRKVGRFAIALWGRRDYLAGRRATELELIDNDSEPRSPPQRALDQLAGGRPVVLHASSLESQLAAVRAGLGVAALPDYLTAGHPELAAVRTRGKPIGCDVWLVVHRDLRTAPAVRAVIDFVAEVVGELGRAFARAA